MITLSKFETSGYLFHVATRCGWESGSGISDAHTHAESSVLQCPGRGQRSRSRQGNRDLVEEKWARIDGF